MIKNENRLFGGECRMYNQYLKKFNISKLLTQQCHQV